MNFVKETEDDRGKIVWLTAGQIEMHVVETKKGFARGGHYHPFESTHIVISGKLIYRECNTSNSSAETVKTVKPVTNIVTPAKHAHMITALEDSVFIEIFDAPYQATIFAPYRSIVEDTILKKGSSNNEEKKTSFED